MGDDPIIVEDNLRGSFKSVDKLKGNCKLNVAAKPVVTLFANIEKEKGILFFHLYMTPPHSATCLLITVSSLSHV